MEASSSDACSLINLEAMEWMVFFVTTSDPPIFLSHYFLKQKSLVHLIPSVIFLSFLARAVLFNHPSDIFSTIIPSFRWFLPYNNSGVKVSFDGPVKRVERVSDWCSDFLLG